jgi:hypothetical protein
MQELRYGFTSDRYRTARTINEFHQLEPDTLIPVTGPKRVRVIVLFHSDSDDGEDEWIHSAIHNPAFDYLKDPQEDVYSISDGKPLHVEE